MKAKPIQLSLIGLISWATVSCTRLSTTCIDPAKVNPDAMCAMVYDTVCGCDGKTYSNACVATNAGVVSFSPGACSGAEK